MKRALLLAAIGLFCFALGTAVIYFAMPSLSPDRVDGTRARLDSLGLLRAEADPVRPAAPDPPLPDATDSTTVADPFPTSQDIIQTLEDSLNTIKNIVKSLQADTTVLNARVSSLVEQVGEMMSEDLEATDLSKSLAKLDAKQLSNILAGIDLETIRLLYEKASARERTRLLESMSPDQGARFVTTLVNGPLPERSSEAEIPDGGSTRGAEEAPSNF